MHSVGIIMAAHRWLQEVEQDLKTTHACRCATHTGGASLRDLADLWAMTRKTRSEEMAFAKMRHMLEWHIGRQITKELLRQHLCATDDVPIEADWQVQRERFFAPAAYGPIPRADREGNTEVKLLTRWISLCSWTFCDCGRMRACAELSGWRVPALKAARVLCTSKRNFKGKCARPICDFTYPESSQADAVAGAMPMESAEAYVCPRKTDWPVYDATSGEFVVCTGEDDIRESMLELTAAEAASLQLAEVYVDYRRESGKISKGPTFNYKKLSVVRIEWVLPAFAERETALRTQAAYRYYQQHPTYAR